MTEESISLLIENFQHLGGTIDQYYLRKDRMCKQTLVNLNGWFSGKNVRDAITKAIAGQKTTSSRSAANIGHK